MPKLLDLGWPPACLNLVPAIVMSVRCMNPCSPSQITQEFHVLCEELKAGSCPEA